MHTPQINLNLRLKRLTVGITEGQVAEEVARLVAVQTGRELAIDANYVSKLERGVITWPNRAYREAFRTFFDAASDAELGFYPSRTRRDAESWRRGPVQGGSALRGLARTREWLTGAGWAEAPMEPRLLRGTPTFQLTRP